MKNSASSLKTWLRCQKLWGLTYVDRKEPVDSGSFEINYGRQFHGLLENDSPELFGSKWSSVINTHFQSYSSHWAVSATKNYTMLEHELRFEFELAPGVVLHGYLDGVAKLNGKTYIVESKTTGADLTGSYWDYRTQDLQVGVYLLAAKHCEALQKYDIAGVIYDVTRRPSIRQKKSESDTAYVTRVESWYFDNRHTVFMRKFMHRSDEELEDLCGEIMMIAEQQQRKQFVKNRDSCYAFRKQCGFYAHCFEGVPLSSTDHFKERTRR